jgi:hypothetical protein
MLSPVTVVLDDDVELEDEPDDDPDVVVVDELLPRVPLTPWVLTTALLAPVDPEVDVW